MNTNKVKLYFIEILFVIIMIFLALFESNVVSKISFAIILITFLFVILLMFRKRNVYSISNKQVTLLMLFLGIIYLTLFYLFGFYFGFNINVVKFGITAIVKFILPISVIIISSEIIRSVLLAQKEKYSSFFTFVGMVLVDISVYTQVYDLTQYDDFLAAVGFITFASMSCNLFYNYISSRYGSKPIIVYRLITSLYSYVIPVVPDVYIFLRSFFRMIVPYIYYLIIDGSFSKEIKQLNVDDNKKATIGTVTFLVVAGAFVYLVSCQFTFGIFIVGSGSMTGTINMGDAVVFKKLGSQDVNENDVIVFKKNDVVIIHRVINIQNVNGEERYFTKGDANQVEDDKYVTRSDIVGKSLFRIRYIGYPTLWLRSLFS